jgi:AraC-like DNA-binding protein
LRAPYWRFYLQQDEGAWVENSKGKTYLDAQHAYLVPANTSFGTGADQEVTQLFVHFVIEPATHIPMNPPPILAVPVSEGLSYLHSRADREKQPETQTLFLKCLVEATLAESGISLRNREMTTRMERTQRLLRQHLRSGIRNADLAEEIHLSENGFVRWFTSEEGISPQAWLARERIHEASFWLHHTDAPLDHIAELHGFCDRYHFSRVFKKHQGISPAAFRKNREPSSPPLTVSS